MPKKIMDSREELRGAMVDTAERVIIAEGVRALTARRLASELNIAVGTTYNVFKHMDHLIADVNARTIQQITEVITSINNSEDDSDEDQLMAYTDAYIGFITENGNLWEALFIGDADPESASHQQNLAETLKLFSHLENALRPISPNADEATIKASARALWAAVHGMLSLVARDRNVILCLGDIRETIRVLVHHHIAGMRSLK